MDEFVSCHPKAKISGFDFICSVSHLSLGVEEEKVAQAIWQGKRGMTLRSTYASCCQGSISSALLWMRGFDHQHSPEVSGTSLERGTQMLSLCSPRSDPAYSHSCHCTLFHKNILIEYPPDKVKFAEWH